MLASALLAAACHAPPPPPRTPAELAADIAEALAAGNIERAEDLAERGLQRHRLEPIVQLWSGVVASLRWEDMRAVSLLWRVRGRAEQAGSNEAEIAGLLGDLLMFAGDYGASIEPLQVGATGKAAARRTAFANLGRALPYRRRNSGPLVTEYPLPEDGLFEFECGSRGRRRTFVLDTGSSMTTLSNSLAAEWALPQRQPAGTVQDSAGREFPVEVARLPQFSVGEIQLGDVPVLLAADERFVLRDLFGGAERVAQAAIGLDLLAQFRLTLDPARKTVAIGLARGFGNEPSVHTVRVDGRCLVPVTIEGLRLWMILDTGASHSSLTHAGLDLLPGGSSRAVPGLHRVHSAMGTSNSVREVRHIVLRVSEVRFADVTMPVIDRGETGFFPIHGVLAVDLLRRCRTTFDGGRVRIEALP